MHVKVKLHDCEDHLSFHLDLPENTPRLKVKKVNYTRANEILALIKAEGHKIVGVAESDERGDEECIRIIYAAK